MSEPDFDKSIFLNCPFDKEFEAILQAIIFAICYMGYRPRLALETQNSAELRLNKIRSMIEDCRFSIHDLSRSQAKRKGEYYRLNMPFELGLDYGCRHYMDGRQDKVILVLEEKPYRYQAALSDLAGCDIQAHGNEPEKAVRIVRNWLAHEARLAAPGPARIWSSYGDFQTYYWNRQLDAGFSEEDIREFPTGALLAVMQEWIAKGQPLP